MSPSTIGPRRTDRGHDSEQWRPDTKFFVPSSGSSTTASSAPSCSRMAASAPAVSSLMTTAPGHRSRLATILLVPSSALPVSRRKSAGRGLAPAEWPGGACAGCGISGPAFPARVEGPGRGAGGARLVRKLDLSWAGGSARRRVSADGLWLRSAAGQAVAAWSSPVSGLTGWMVTL